MSIAKKIRPLGDRIIVKRLDAEEKTKSGIIIPGNAQEKPQKGEVLAVGPGRRDDQGKLIPMEVAVGDVVMFKKWGSDEFKEEGEDLLVMKQDDVIAVLVK